MCNLTSVILVCCATLLCSVLCQNISFQNVQVVLVDMHHEETTIPRKSYPNLHRVIHDSELFALRIVNENIPIIYNNSITDVKKTNRIELDNDKITQIEAGAFANLTSVFISLKHNLLEEIDEKIFTGLPGIRGIDFDYNKIRRIHQKAFCNMKDLSTLILSHNQISHWSIEFLDGSPVSNIFISSNQLTEIPISAFQYLSGVDTNRTMEFMDFTNNKIEVVKPGSLNQVKTVRYLYLGNNELKNITLGLFRGVDHVNYLSLRNNKINCLPDNYAEIMGIVQQLDLSGNPMRCDCIRNVRQWSDANKGAIILPQTPCV